MAKFFDQFPLVLYDINKGNDRASNYQLPVNVMVRVRVLVEKLDQVFHYYEHTIKEDETPEILAENFYGDPEAHWLILLANNITDPQYDWPLNSRSFDKYIISKYGSKETAETTWSEWYEMHRVDDPQTGEIYLKRYKITEEQYDDVALQTEPTLDRSITIGSTVLNVYFPYKERISAYDLEIEKNEAKRNIKMIKREYYQSIRDEFRGIMSRASGIKNNNSMLRNL
jgi:hypothetical protein